MKFDGLEPRRCEDIKKIVAPQRGPKKFGTFEKQAPGPGRSLDSTNVLHNALPLSYQAILGFAFSEKEVLGSCTHP